MSDIKKMNKTEYLLADINLRIKNKNIFLWKFFFGFLISVPFEIVALLISTAVGPYNMEAMSIAVLLFIVGLVLWIINIVLGIIALYKSTKDYKDLQSENTKQTKLTSQDWDYELDD